MKRAYRRFVRAFRHVPNKVLLDKNSVYNSAKYMAYVLVYFLITQDINRFLLKVVAFLQNTKRSIQVQLFHAFLFFSKPYLSDAVMQYGLGGVYFKVSGKVGSSGGEKKYKKIISVKRPNFNNRSLKLQRSVQTL